MHMQRGMEYGAGTSSVVEQPQCIDQVFGISNQSLLPTACFLKSTVRLTVLVVRQELSRALSDSHRLALAP